MEMLLRHLKFGHVDMLAQHMKSGLHPPVKASATSPEFDDVPTPSMASRSHPPGCCIPCSIRWFHPRIAWLKPPSDTPNCIPLVISSTSDHHIPRFPRNPLKSIWNPYVHGRRRSSSLLVADCSLVVVWNKSYGILEVHLARRQAC